MKAALFDFNGTLFNDARFHVEAWGAFSRKYKHYDPTEEEIRRDFIGPNDSIILRQQLGDALTDEEILNIAEEKESAYRRIAGATPETRALVAGAPELFDLLCARGVPFAVATASYISNVRFYMNELGLGRWVDMAHMVYEDGTLRGKPEPDFYLEAARRVNVPIGDCVVVEDSPTGLEAARRAGAGRIIAIATTFPEDYLRALPGVDVVIRDYTGAAALFDIPELL